jgi:hypothetical protein
MDTREYLLSSDNLCKDQPLREQMDSSGFVPLSFFASITRVSRLTVDMDIILSSCNSSSVLEVKAGERNATEAMLVRRKEEWERWVSPKEKISIEVEKIEHPKQVPIKITTTEANPKEITVAAISREKGVRKSLLDWSIAFDRRWNAQRRKVNESNEELFPNLRIKEVTKTDTKAQDLDDDLFADLYGHPSETKPKVEGAGNEADRPPFPPKAGEADFDPFWFLNDPKPSTAGEQGRTGRTIEEEKKIDSEGLKAPATTSPKVSHSSKVKGKKQSGKGKKNSRRR